MYYPSSSSGLCASASEPSLPYLCELGVLRERFPNLERSGSYLFLPRLACAGPTCLGALLRRCVSDGLRPIDRSRRGEFRFLSGLRLRLFFCGGPRRGFRLFLRRHESSSFDRLGHSACERILAPIAARVMGGEATRRRIRHPGQARFAPIACRSFSAPPCGRAQGQCPCLRNLRRLAGAGIG